MAAKRKAKRKPNHKLNSDPTRKLKHKPAITLNKTNVLMIGIILVPLLLFLIVDALRPPELSAMAKTACEIADREGTCESRLIELGIVTKEDCCKAIGSCCG